MESDKISTRDEKLFSNNVIFVKKSNKKKRKKYSSDLKSVQKWEKGISQAVSRVAKAVDSGISTYQTERDKSAQKKKDGAILDYPQNLTKALGKTIRKASLAPYDVAETLNTKPFRKRLSILTRLAIFPLLQ
jgi:hypothetical protein